MFDASSQTQKRLFGPPGDRIYLISSCTFILGCLMSVCEVVSKSERKSSVSRPVLYLHMLPFLLSVPLSVIRSVCLLTQVWGWKSGASLCWCIAPSTLWGPYWGVVCVEDMFSKEGRFISRKSDSNSVPLLVGPSVRRLSRLSMSRGHVEAGDHHEVGFAEVHSRLQLVRHHL